MKGINKHLCYFVVKRLRFFACCSRGFGGGADDSLMKPFRPDDILSLVNQHLPELASEIYRFADRSVFGILFTKTIKSKGLRKMVAREAVLSYRYDKSACGKQPN